MTTRLLASMGVASLLVACGSSGTTDGSVPGTDAGSGADAHDLGSAGDLGSGLDATTSPDAPMSMFDAGPRPDLGPVMAHPMLAGLADDELRSLGDIDCTDPDGETDHYCRAATEYSGMVYDPVAHAMYTFGGGHASTVTDAIQKLDLRDTLRWSDLYTPTPCASMVDGNIDHALGAWSSGTSGPYPRPLSAHTYDMTAVATAQNEFVLLGRAFTQGGQCAMSISNYVGGPIAHYSLDRGVWEFSADTGSSGLGDGLPAAELDPVSGYFVAISEQGLAVYDPATRTMVGQTDTIRTTAGASLDQAQLAYANHMVYFPPTDRMYFFARGTPVQVFEVALDRTDLTRSTVTLLSTTGPSSPHNEPGYDYDSRNQIIGGGVIADTFYVFDPRTATWTAEAMTGGSVDMESYHALAYDPVDNVFIIRTASETWAYRYRR